MIAGRVTESVSDLTDPLKETVQAEKNELG